MQMYLFMRLLKDVLNEADEIKLKEYVESKGSWYS